MAKHEVKFTISSGLELKKSDIEFDVKVNDKVLGTLMVSKGSVNWRPRFVRKGSTFKISWNLLDELFQKHGKETKG